MNIAMKAIKLKQKENINMRASDIDNALIDLAACVVISGKRIKKIAAIKVIANNPTIEFSKSFLLGAICKATEHDK